MGIWQAIRVTLLILVQLGIASGSWAKQPPSPVATTTVLWTKAQILSADPQRSLRSTTQAAGQRFVKELTSNPAWTFSLRRAGLRWVLPTGALRRQVLSLWATASGSSASATPEVDRLNEWLTRHPTLLRRYPRFILMGATVQLPISERSVPMPVNLTMSSAPSSQREQYTTKLWAWSPGWPVLLVTEIQCSAASPACSDLKSRVQDVAKSSFVTQMRRISIYPDELLQADSADDIGKDIDQVAPGLGDELLSAQPATLPGDLGSPKTEFSAPITLLAKPQKPTTFWQNLSPSRKVRFAVMSTVSAMGFAGFAGTTFAYTKNAENPTNDWLGPMVSCATLGVGLGIAALVSLFEK